MIVEGYEAAAREFAIEAGLGDILSPGLSCIEERTTIRTAILDGKIELAIELINDFNPEVS